MTTSKILLNCGPSERGFHRLEGVLRCPSLFAHHAAGRLDSSNAEPLVRGAIGHTGLAHAYRQLMAVQRGEDPNAFYGPYEAMELAAKEFGSCAPAQLKVATTAVRNYLKRWADRYEVYGVEAPYETVFLGYRYTARIDLLIRDEAGKIWVLDHKFVGRTTNDVVDRYTMSGQFLGLQHLGARHFGDKFGGVYLNLVGCATAATSFRREPVRPAPHALQHFPETVRYAEERIADVERRMAAGEPVPMAPSEHTCIVYGKPCPAHYLCRFGVTTTPDVGDTFIVSDTFNG